MRKGAMLVGYARVSKADHQDTAAQVKALRKAGCERIFEEKASGGSWDRPQFHDQRTKTSLACRLRRCASFVLSDPATILP